MSKTKITEGKWKPFKNKYIATYTVVNDDVIIADTLTKADAEAISLVPQMIELLINLENDDGSIPQHLWDKRNGILGKVCEDVHNNIGV